MGLIQNILAVLVVLGLLVTFHEFGHFWVARRCGVKVLRFSVGFGKPLWSRVDRHGTEFAIAAIPLGGYVKMLDEREGNVPADQLDQAFNRKSVWARIAIVAAGPLANFLLALVAYWALFVAGTTTVVPVVGEVTPQSPAAEAGLEQGMEVTAVRGEPVRSWDDINLKLVAAIGASGSLAIETRAEGSSVARTYPVEVDNWLVGQDPPEPLGTLGIRPWRPDMPAVIGQLVENEPAVQAGLQPGDRVVAIDGEPVADWPDLVQRVRARPGEAMELDVQRGDASVTLSLTPRGNRLDDGSEIGYIGAGVAPVDWPQKYQRDIRYGPLEAVGQAASRTAEMTVLTFDAVRKMLVGLISPTNLSGPITIARIAGDTARSGLESFVNFMAYLSISLGVLNLLPIPVLDGGHLLYYLIEAVRGRPVSERTQAVGLKVGLALVGTLMIMALYFDVMRLW
ncbi:RIP metalloprotease RseP [Halomonas denitrificans]|uniref:RIP metalloprotease RseP n=1 Tax=Halomonas TaxID=2745 RepID=UPI001A8E2796|nr:MULTISPECIES: RIP metalloprotease RseP [Halomonas]MBN8411829.1 RIP metalloprotease RseP [Halomonas litopenaei]MED5297372.1 RIP metalloprotease RseP [Pseudomonadota bacterium]MBY5927807.1 RIP metalloprotease RseP [Halomonas sp. DP8Y7-3]MBY5967642.1 RIP metalloprotease RseP [Halomonas denitrificans]MBY5983147.1 RIP metalloprotease RseP [Halomonas sp. DP5Y7-2]